MSDRNFPQSAEAERALLGGLVLAPEQIDEVSGLLAHTDFYRRDHGHLYSLLCMMRGAREHVDLVTVTERVARGGHDEMFGGLAYVIGLLEAVPSTANLRHYADIIRGHAERRRLIAALDTARAALYDAAEVPGMVCAALVQEIDAVTSDTGDAEWSILGEHAAQVVDDAERAARGERVASIGPDLPWADLRALLSSLPRGELVVVAARPAMGKTAFAMSLVEAICWHDEQRQRPMSGFGIYSLEVSTPVLARGMVLREAREIAGVPFGSDRLTSRHIERGDLDARGWDAVISAASSVARAPVYVSRRSALDAVGFESGVRRLQRTMALRGQSLDVVVVDYLQLMQLADKQGENRAALIGDLTRRMKVTAAELGITVICLSQLNRECEKRTDKRPMLSDLRDSGAIEQDAAVVLGLYRDVVYNNEAPDADGEVLVLKNRYGRTGTVPMRFEGPALRWREQHENPLGDL